MYPSTACVTSLPIPTNRVRGEFCRGKQAGGRHVIAGAVCICASARNLLGELHDVTPRVGRRAGAGGDLGGRLRLGLLDHLVPRDGEAPPPSGGGRGGPGDLRRAAAAVRATSRPASPSTASGPGSCVGIFLERSAEFVVAAYAVLRAGAAYLPLDTATPADRLAFVLADAGAAAVVTHGTGHGCPPGPWRTVRRRGGRGSRPAADVAPATGRPRLRDLHLGQHGPAQGRRADPREPGQPRRLARRRVRASRPTDRASQVASVGFDAAVWEIWPALAAGAHPARRRRRRPAGRPQLLRDWLVGRADHRRVRPDGDGRAADPPRVAAGHRPADPAHRRGRPAPPPAGRAAVRPGQQLRADRVHGGRHVGRGRPARGRAEPAAAVDRPADRRHRSRSILDDALAPVPAGRAG